MAILLTQFPSTVNLGMIYYVQHCPGVCLFVWIRKRVKSKEIPAFLASCYCPPTVSVQHSDESRSPRAHTEILEHFSLNLFIAWRAHYLQYYHRGLKVKTKRGRKPHSKVPLVWYIVSRIVKVKVWALPALPRQTWPPVLKRMNKETYHGKRREMRFILYCHTQKRNK